MAAKHLVHWLEMWLDKLELLVNKIELGEQDPSEAQINQKQP
ncbi:MAG TPA: hypothetical protein VJ795_16870 [Rheinheimera sp.]|nr:hypothetical protein [Rheinheimera sp.]HJS16751.1 hypothetical protein [Rheinheimera sp.]